MKQDLLIETLQQLGFTQYEAQCYLGLLQQHPLNGSQAQHGVWSSAFHGLPDTQSPGRKRSCCARER